MQRAGEVSLELTQNGTPFVVVVGPDGSATCLREPISRVRWDAATYRIHVGVADEQPATGFTLRVRAATSSVMPYTP